MSGSKVRIMFDSAVEKPLRLESALPVGRVRNDGHTSQVIIVCIEAPGWFTFGALYFGPL